VRWDLYDNSRSWSRFFNFTEREMFVVFFQEVVLSEKIYSENSKLSPECNQISFEIYFIASEISVSNKLLPWLINIKRVWKFLSS